MKNSEFHIPSPIFEISGFNINTKLYIKRDDLIHPIISGNKYRKLKYNIESYYENKYKGILSFGGVFSNHVHALAAYASYLTIPCVLILRGEEDAQNPTLQFVKNNKAILYFVSRTDFRDKDNSQIIRNIISNYADYLVIPEGGNNGEGIKGVMETVKEIKDQAIQFDYLAVSAGTGATAAGIIKGLKAYSIKSKLIVFSALKGLFLKDTISSLAACDPDKYIFTDEYSFGGYAKTNLELINFINDFYLQTAIPLDPIYNGKLVYGLKQMMLKGKIEFGSTVLWIHTGGLQGISAYNYLNPDKALIYQPV